MKINPGPYCICCGGRTNDGPHSKCKDHRHDYVGFCHEFHCDYNDDDVYSDETENLKDCNCKYGK
jgi:hypothetical protein